MLFQEETNNRIKSRSKRSLFDVNTMLEHFVIISYKVPVQKIQHIIPKPFKLWTFKENGAEYALVSAVPFKDKDFSFYRISKILKFNMFQTNFRTYIIDERNGENSSWFFSTTLGSRASFIPRTVWKMPWKYGKYNFEFELKEGQYSSYKMNIVSKQGNGNVDIKSTENKMALLPGFKSLEEQVLILTHPVNGYFSLSENEIGTYKIWHPKLDLHEGVANNIYFELFEKLGFLNKSEMNNPHSILITREIEFDILLPPKKVQLNGVLK